MTIQLCCAAACAVSSVACVFCAYVVIVNARDIGAALDKVAELAQLADESACHADEAMQEAAEDARTARRASSRAFSSAELARERANRCAAAANHCDDAKGSSTAPPAQTEKRIDIESFYREHGNPVG